MEKKEKFDGSTAKIGDIVFEVSDEDARIIEKADNKILGCKEALSTILDEMALQQQVKRLFWSHYQLDEEEDKLLRRGLALTYNTKTKKIFVQEIKGRELERALRGFL